ncbi:hypothetical protein AXF42_Ash000311 [Apostasia shenzhenica]|uniref:CRIB domain-containing protein n=1 Tax=Apostasia shenzhenica TaxID=1088818 RepID=A0A2I0AG15_9ASPA|nr:hypothetical protein AXF42_Ash000311 [Apostasia shenzhenica]
MQPHLNIINQPSSSSPTNAAQHSLPHSLLLYFPCSLKGMRERMDRFSSFPFSVSCVSHSSVDVMETDPRRQIVERVPPMPTELLFAEAGEREVKMKVLSGGNIGAGIHKVVMRGIRNLSQLFAERDEDNAEMVIGYPTNVHHVAHIGLDDSTEAGLGATNGWDGASEQIFSLNHAISLRQFGLAMNHA